MSLIVRHLRARFFNPISFPLSLPTRLYAPPHPHRLIPAAKTFQLTYYKQLTLVVASLIERDLSCRLIGIARLWMMLLGSYERTPKIVQEMHPVSSDSIMEAEESIYEE